MLSEFRTMAREDKVFGMLALCLFFVPLIFSLFTFENFEAIKFSSFSVILGIAVLVLIFGRRGELKQTPPWPLTVISAALILWALVNALFSQDRFNSVFGFYYRFGNGLVFLAEFLAFVLLLASSLNRRKAGIISAILVGGGLAVALFGILQNWGIGYYAGLEQAGFVRPPSLLGNPNFSSLFVAMALPYAVWHFFSADAARTKIYYGFAFVTMVFSVSLMASRGSLLALAVGVLVWLALSCKRIADKSGFAVAVVVILSVFAVGVFSLSRPDSFRSAWQLKDENTILRLKVWETAVRGIASRPWVGVGLGNFHVFFEQSDRQGLKSFQGEFDDAHNLFVHLAVTGGLPMAGLFIALLAWPLAANFRSLKDNNLAGANIAAVCVFITGAFFNPVSVGVYAGLAAVLSLTWWQATAPPGSGRAGGPNRWFYKAAKPAAAVLGALAIIYGINLLLGELLFGSAARAYTRGDYQTANKLGGLAILFHPLNAHYRVYQTASQILAKENLSSVPGQIRAYAGYHPKESRTWLFTSRLYLLLFYETGEKGYLMEARAQLQKSLEINPHYTDRYGLLAIYQYINQDLHAANISLNRVLTVNPEVYGAWLLKARIHQELGQSRQTLYALERAYKLHPELQQLKHSLANLRSARDIKAFPITVTFNPAKMD